METGTKVIVIKINEEKGGAKEIITTITGSFNKKGRKYYTTKAFGPNTGFPPKLIKKQRGGGLMTPRGKVKRQKRGSVI